MNFFSFSFGCRVNQAEKEQLDKKLLESGYLYNENKPDFYIINTCAVTQKAEREARQKIYQVNKKFPQTKIIVTGCSATYWKNFPKKFSFKTGLDLNTVIFVPNSEKTNIPEIISKIVETRHSVSLQKTKNLYKNSKYLKSGKLLIKIQDGCNRYCSYCIVPYLRGKPQSKKIDDIIEEINLYRRDTLQCVSTPITEVIFTAINTELFGRDTGESLIDLIKRTLDETDIPKISFGSIHPWSLTDEFFDFYLSYCRGLINQTSTNDRIVPFFHIPIQSGSNRILKLMRRGYMVEEIREKLDKLRAINPQIKLGTDIINNYPGENEEDKKQTLEFIKKNKFSKVHSFRYSERKIFRNDGP